MWGHTLNASDVKPHGVLESPCMAAHEAYTQTVCAPLQGDAPYAVAATPVRAPAVNYGLRTTQSRLANLSHLTCNGRNTLLVTTMRRVPFSGFTGQVLEYA